MLKVAFVAVFAVGLVIGLVVRIGAVEAQTPPTSCAEYSAAIAALHPGVPFGASCTRDGIWSLQWQSATIARPSDAVIEAKVIALRSTASSTYPTYETFVDAVLECTSGAACDKLGAMRAELNTKKAAEGKPLIGGTNPTGKKIVQTPVAP